MADSNGMDVTRELHGLRIGLSEYEDRWGRYLAVSLALLAACVGVGGASTLFEVLTWFGVALVVSGAGWFRYRRNRVELKIRPGLVSIRRVRFGAEEVQEIPVDQIVEVRAFSQPRRLRIKTEVGVVQLDLTADYVDLKWLADQIDGLRALGLPPDDEPVPDELAALLLRKARADQSTEG